MMASGRSRHSIILALVLLGLCATNGLWWQSVVFGMVLLVCVLALAAKSIGSLLYSSESPFLGGLIGIWFFLSAVIVLGSLAYYAYALPALMGFAIVFLVLTAAVLLAKPEAKSIFHFPLKNLPSAVWISGLISLIGIAAVFVFASQAQILEAVDRKSVV